MIGFFPDPYPDELLYSACARYTQRVDYPNKQTAMIDLFGKRGLSAIVDFPTRLEYFLSTFSSHNYPVDEIIDKHTLFPFYEPFVIAERAAVIRNEMKSVTDNHLQSRLATNIEQIKSADFLRFCSLCVEDDRKEFGETYWHRIHQLGGIFICPKHQCFLQNSSVDWDRKSSSFFHAADKFIKVKNHTFIDSKNAEHQLFVYLAENAQWLLNQSQLSLKTGELRERYYNLLLEQEYAYYNGRVKNTKLRVAFTDFFPQKILDGLGCSLKTSNRNWLSRMTEKVLADVLYHPIRHLLLLRFLGLSAKELFTEFIEFKPFGDPPYPCLNKVSSHYQKLTIKDCQVFDNLTKGEKYRRPIAIFTCDCGFIYQRLGPDKAIEDRLQYNSVRQYGDLWEQKLAEHWADLDLSLGEIARRFGTTTLLIARHAIRLQLPMNREGARTLRGYAGHFNPRKDFSGNLAKHRSQWIKISKKHSQKSRKFLVGKFPFLYSWLKRNDNEWFELHLPKPLRFSEKRLGLIGRR